MRWCILMYVRWKTTASLPQIFPMNLWRPQASQLFAGSTLSCCFGALSNRGFGSVSLCTSLVSGIGVWDCAILGFYGFEALNVTKPYTLNRRAGVGFRFT